MSGQNSPTSGFQVAANSLWNSLAIPAALAITLLVCVPSSLPLGIPGEWTWTRNAVPADAIELADRLLPALLWGTLLFFGITWVQHRIERFSRPAVTTCIVLLAIGMSFWLHAVLQGASSPHRELRPLWVLYDRYATGYFLSAIEDRRDASTILREYNDQMQAGDVLHEGTHPPGLLLLSRGAVRLAESSPGLGQFCQFMVAERTRRMFRDLESRAGMATQLSASQLQGLAIFSTASIALISGLPVVVYLLLRLFQARPHAWQGASLSITLPSIAVFQPRSDAIYATTCALILLLSLRTIRASSRPRQLGTAVITGILVFCCLLVSLAHIPVIVAIFCYAAVLLLVNHLAKNLPEAAYDQQLNSRVLTSAAAIIATVLLTTGVFGWLTDCPLLNVWQQNLANHAAFYNQYERTWWKWFLINPLELGLATGLPLLTLVPAALFRQVGTIFPSNIRSTAASSEVQHAALSLSLAVTWLILHLSGKNMGEAARLWTFLTPWWIVMLCTANAATGKTPPARNWRILLIAQLVACLLTTSLISGYSTL